MIKEIISSLTLEQKALMVSGKTVWETFEIENKVPSIFLADGPHGLRKQEGESDHLGLNKSIPATCFPTSATVANSWDIHLAEEIGRALGREAKTNNVQVLLGPGLNIKRNPLCGRNFEYFSEDPYLSGKMAAGYVRGIQDNGTIACPKHFAANNQELRRMASDSIIDMKTLREIYLTGFEIVVKESQPKSIMTSYNKINGVYANEDKFLLRDILVDEWGFDGFTVSDWGGSNNHVEGVKNGGHLEMPSTGLYGPIEIVKAVESNQLQESILDERVEEILKVTLNIKKESEKIDYDTQHSIAREAAMKSIVMLKNEGNLLPLNKAKKIAIIGDFASNPRYQGSGSSVVNAKKLETTLDVIENYPLNIIGYEKGFERNGLDNDQMLDDAVNLAKNSDVVLLYVGLDEVAESEGKDRNNMVLAANQLKMIQALSEIDTKVVAILSSGSSIDVSWEKRVDGILHGYLSGEAGASAMLEVITGNYNPSGKLNETYPVSYEDIPFGEMYPETNERVFYKEGIYVGYRYFDSVNKDIAFPFGFGLSYTQFEYDNFSVDSKGVTFSIKNTESFPGEEIAQLYIENPSAKTIHPKQELKGFEKIYLEPNEEKTVFIPFDDYSFRMFNCKTNRWEVETETYEIKIASNSRDVRLRGNFFVQGDCIELPYDLSTIPNYLTGEVSHVSHKEFESFYGKIIAETLLPETILGRNSTIKDMERAKSPIARFVKKRIESMITKSEEKGQPNLNLLFNYNMPFRAIAKMTNGMVSIEMVDSLLIIINGRHFYGIAKLIQSTISGSSQKRKFKKRLQNS